ncbi:hypothetical protein BURMUCF1_A0251, partial [Burkholderia multivorans ATCC BAA-247]
CACACGPGACDRDSAQRRDRAGQRRLRRPFAPARSPRACAARDPAARHARRPRHVDAAGHQGDPRLAGTGRGFRRAGRRACRERGHLHRLCEPYRGDGAR